MNDLLDGDWDRGGPGAASMQGTNELLLIKCFMIYNFILGGAEEIGRNLRTVHLYIHIVLYLWNTVKAGDRSSAV